MRITDEEARALVSEARVWPNNFEGDQIKTYGGLLVTQLADALQERLDARP